MPKVNLIEVCQIWDLNLGLSAIQSRHIGTVVYLLKDFVPC
jgi:hypothetical protein